MFVPHDLKNHGQAPDVQPTFDSSWQTNASWKQTPYNDDKQKDLYKLRFEIALLKGQVHTA